MADFDLSFFSLRLSELDVLFDLVVEVIHGVPRVSHPIIPKPIWTQGLVPQVSVPEAPKRMVPRFMRSGVRIHKFQFLQCRVEVAPDNKGRRIFLRNVESPLGRPRTVIARIA